MKKQLIQEFNLRLAAMENEIITLQNQIANLSQPTCTDNDLAQMKMLVSKFPLSNLKNAQYLHATQLQVANLFEQLEHEKSLRRQQDETIQQLQIVIRDLQKKVITPTVEQPVNTPLLTPSSTEPESTDTQRRLAELKPLKRLTMDLYDRIHSIDCGRDKKLIWRISSFSLMFDNAKAAELERQKGIDPHPKIPCNFHSPPFYTSTHGYRFDMKLYPYGCSPATGESASLVINILPGEFDPILSWPFRLIFRINVINLSEPNDTWTKIVDPKDNQNSACFIRPCTSYGNPSICFPFLIPHNQLFKSSSPFILNDTMFIEVNLEESK